MASSAGSVAGIPLDAWYHIGFCFLSCKAIVIVSLTCRALRNRYAEIFNSIAQNERARIGLPATITDNHLTDECIIHHWRHLTPQECRAIRTNILASPLEYYTIESPQILLSEEYLVSRADDNALTVLINGEKDLKRAIIIANSISATYIRLRSLRELANKAPPEIALEIANSIPIAHVQSTALADLALRAEQLLEESLKIIRKIPNQDVKSETLSKLALRKGIPLKTALAIARMIPLNYVKSRTLSALSLTENLSRETSLEIVRDIPNHGVKTETIVKLEKKDRH